MAVVTPVGKALEPSNINDAIVSKSANIVFAVLGISITDLAALDDLVKGERQVQVRLTKSHLYPI